MVSKLGINYNWGSILMAIHYSEHPRGVPYGSVPVYRYFYAVLKPVFLLNQTSIPHGMLHLLLTILEDSKPT